VGKAEAEERGSEALSKLHNCPKHAPLRQDQKKTQHFILLRVFVLYFAAQLFSFFRHSGDNSLVSRDIGASARGVFVIAAC